VKSNYPHTLGIVRRRQERQRLYAEAERRVREGRVADRVAAFRHALLWAGYTQQSIDMAVERNREWIESGDPLERKMR
jgi:hypothetical protein